MKRIEDVKDFIDVVNRIPVFDKQKLYHNCDYFYTLDKFFSQSNKEDIKGLINFLIFLEVEGHLILQTSTAILRIISEKLEYNNLHLSIEELYELVDYLDYIAELYKPKNLKKPSK